MEKSRFLAEGELSNLSESFLVAGGFLDKTYTEFTYKICADLLQISHQPNSAPSRLVRPLG